MVNVRKLCLLVKAQQYTGQNNPFGKVYSNQQGQALVLTAGRSFAPVRPSDWIVWDTVGGGFKVVTRQAFAADYEPLGALAGDAPMVLIVRPRQEVDSGVRITVSDT